MSSVADLAVFDAATYANGDPTTFGLPLEQYAYLRDEAPCFLQEFDDPMLIDRCWVVSRHADIDAVDRDAELYAADRGFVTVYRTNPVDPLNGGLPAMLTSDGDKHRAHRNVLARAFTPRAVGKLEATFRRYATEVVDEALDRGTFNFARTVAHTMPMEALGDVLGVPQADREKFFGWVDTFAAPFDSRITPSFDDVIMATGNLIVYAEELAELKRREPADDVMSRLAAAEYGDEPPLTHDEILGDIVVLASGAAESTRTAMSHGMHELMRNPQAMAWMRDHADDLPASAIQEMVRIATPFTHLVRTATRDHELHGQQIREGDTVAMLFAAGNFDDRVFENPHVFDPARADTGHLSFGRGAHKCLGRHVASLEMKILFEELLRRTSDIQPAGPIDYVRDSFSRGVYDLPVTVTPA